MTIRKSKKDIVPTLSTEEASEILQQVFMDCYEDSNSVPVEKLQSYASYRSERLSLQRRVAIIGFWIFLLIPILFVSPRFNISGPVDGNRGLPEYTVSVGGILPIKSVVAVQGKYSLPMYQKDNRVFVFEPTANGKLEVKVNYFSNQWETMEIKVDGLDSKKPKYIGNSVSPDGNTLYIYVEDDASGVDYEKSYIEVKGSGDVLPDAYDEMEGYFEIRNVPKDGVLHVFDKAGNELTVTIKKVE